MDLTFRQIDTFLSSMPVNIFMKDTQGRYLYSSQRGLSVLGKTDLELWEDADLARDFQNSDQDILATHTPYEREYSILDKGQKRWFYLRKSVAIDKAGTVLGISGIVFEITAEKNIRLQREKERITDNLTGLYNRQYLKDLIADGQDRNLLGLISIDANKLKHINDTFGHYAGDEYLFLLAQGIKAAVDKTDIVCRTGGDEFLVLCYRKDTDMAATITNIKERISQDQVHGVELSIAAGCAYIERNESLFSAYKRADVMMYQDKEKYRARE